LGGVEGVESDSKISPSPSVRLARRKGNYGI